MEQLHAQPLMADRKTPPTRIRTRYWEPHFVVSATFLFFIFARYIVLGARRDWLAAIRLEFLLGSALIIVAVALASGQGFQYSRSRGIIAGISLLFVAMLVQLPFAADPPRAEFIMNERVMKFAVLTLLIAVFVHSPRMMEWFLLTFLFACLYVTQESVRGLISGSLVWENQGVQRLHGAVRMYAHPNSLAGLALGTVPFIAFLMPVIRDWRKRGMMLATLATSLTCVLFSGSRTGYVGLFVFLIFWWAVSRNKLKFLGASLAIAVVVLPLLPDQYVERFKSIGGEEAEGHSKEKRIVILEDAWQIFLEHPAGVGVASFPAVRRARFGRVQDTHNLYLEVATNLGVQGLAAFFFLIGAILAACRRSHDSFASQLRATAKIMRDPDLPRQLRAALKKHSEDLRLMCAVAKATAGFLIVRLALGFFGMDLYEPYWWFSAGLGISLTMMAGWTRGNTNRLLSQAQPVAV